MDPTPTITSPLVSVVIPAHNEELYLKACIESMLKQDRDFGVEIIVINNASTDGTREVAAAFPGVRIIDESRKGLSSARQAGFLAAHGQLIANIDADSQLPAGWLAKVATEFRKHPKLVALSGRCVYNDAPWIANAGVRVFYYIVYSIYLVNRFVLKRASVLQGGNSVIKKSALEQIGGYNPAFVFYGEDADIARRLHPFGPVKFSLSIFTFTSSRRFKTEGFFTMAARYGLNYFSTVFRKKPATAQALDIRTPTGLQNKWREFALAATTLFVILGFSRLMAPPVAKAARRMENSGERIVTAYEAKHPLHLRHYHYHARL